MNKSNEGTAFEVGGTTCKLKYGFKALIEIENEHDKGLPAIVAELQTAPRLSTILSLFTAGLLIDGERGNEGQATAVIEALGIERASELMGDALAQAMAGPAKVRQGLVEAIELDSADKGATAITRGLVEAAEASGGVGKLVEDLEQQDQGTRRRGRKAA